MWRRELDLQVGEMVRVGSQYLIVLESDDGEVTLKVCSADELEGAEDWSSPSPR